ncbi:hypothetical protein [Pandoraea sp.]|uniref:hypothetical protein n=1 Tax=Pandoraea sp. TaxID=1883445 RepID=UPI0035AE6560
MNTQLAIGDLDFVIDILKHSKRTDFAFLALGTRYRVGYGPREGPELDRRAIGDLCLPIASGVFVREGLQICVGPRQRVALLDCIARVGVEQERGTELRDMGVALNALPSGSLVFQQIQVIQNRLGIAKVILRSGNCGIDSGGFHERIKCLSIGICTLKLGFRIDLFCSFLKLGESLQVFFFPIRACDTAVILPLDFADLPSNFQNLLAKRLKRFRITIHVERINDRFRDDREFLLAFVISLFCCKFGGRILNFFNQFS